MHIKLNVVWDAIKLTPVLKLCKNSCYIVCDVIMLWRAELKLKYN